MLMTYLAKKKKPLIRRLFLLVTKKPIFFKKQSKLDKDFFAAPPDLSSIFYSNELAVPEKCTHAIESLSTLNKLLAEKRARKEHPSLRYMVDESGTAWFARERQVGIQSPKHYQMTGELQKNARCRAAGTIKFTNSSCTMLKNLNHKSGDFRPSFYSLRLFLAILILNEELLPFKLPKTLIVKEIGSNGEVARKHRWPVVQIKDWVDTFRGNTELITQLTKQNASTRLVQYPG